MIDLTTKYMGFTLKNPVIIGSSGLTNSVAAVKEHASNGAAAVVLKSLFEEQIRMEAQKNIDMAGSDNLYTEAQDYISNYIRAHNLNEYLKLIEDCRKSVDIPVFASINCVTSDEWPAFAQKIESAGASGLELNVFILPSDFSRDAEENENTYFKIVDQVKKYVKIPVSLKISYHFTNLAQMIQKLSFTGISGIVLFNRFFSPDFDLINRQIVPSHIFSNPADLSVSLRWVGIMYDRVRCDICASTGIHDASGVIKQIMAGANAVQMVSSIYKNGSKYIKVVLEEMEKWMENNGFHSLSEMRGQMSQARIKDPAGFERVQFMKYFAGID
ncbi:MAG: dihydroorotate dehydrogenase-like protein [Sphingobacteriales bacterium]|nr:dihydroorotate dehydrogenase-like protein [Sphingobacteriales bacterium]